MLAEDMGLITLNYAFEYVKIWVLTFYEPIVPAFSLVFSHFK